MQRQTLRTFVQSRQPGRELCMEHFLWQTGRVQEKDAEEEAGIPQKELRFLCLCFAAAAVCSGQGADADDLDGDCRGGGSKR